MSQPSKFATTGTTALVIERFAHAAGSDELKLALVGCGGRGAGAANQALNADSNTRLVAVADLFRDKLEVGLKSLKAQHKERADVPPEFQFTGLDAYQKAISMADVVICATPCAFRPAHFEEAVRQGKHVFLEKPVAVDAPGIRRVLAAAAEAKKKNLKVAVGFQRRHSVGYREVVKRIHDGAIGQVAFTRSYANTPLRTGLERKPEFSELEYQCRNWYYFSWLSADFIVDNLVHGIDISNWVHGSYPVRCHGMGGVNKASPDYGNLYDHFSVEWEYATGARLIGQCDRHVNCWVSVTNHATGTQGAADFLDGREMYEITGANPWQLRTKQKFNPYQLEHDEFFQAIRHNLPYNEADYGAKSTLTAIMGRMAAYSGKVIEWDAALNSNLRLAPDITSLNDPPPVLPDKDGFYPIPVPGKTVAL
ncbi:MAG: Gfo/Idh/MocA family oxidoreductase [Verrucomicrobia bacterium]|nr:Gfo/Idh/MocA family oxidoreductase [Verrucomicrobiota bacterium]